MTRLHIRESMLYDFTTIPDTFIDIPVTGTTPYSVKLLGDDAPPFQLQFTAEQIGKAEIRGERQPFVFPADNLAQVAIPSSFANYYLRIYHDRARSHFIFKETKPDMLSNFILPNILSNLPEDMVNFIVEVPDRPAYLEDHIPELA